MSSIASNAPANVASSFLVVGERTNITGSPKFAKALKAGDWDACLAIAKQQVESGANIIDINVDEALIEGETTMVKFLNLIAAEPDIVEEFEQQHNVKFNAKYYAGGDNMLGLIAQSPAGTYDIILSDAEFVQQLIKS